MGVLNVTPDSFSDGGDFLESGRRDRARQELQAEGADLIDVGGESTRPGAEPVAEAGARARDAGVRGAPGGALPLSIDTSKAAVARAALAAGASFVNDVTALRADAELGRRGGRRRRRLSRPHEGRAALDAGRSPLRRRRLRGPGVSRGPARWAIREGIPEERVWLDPGIGFGKTLEHNLELIRRLDEIVAIGRPVVFGASRKRLPRKLTGRHERERVAGTWRRTSWPSSGARRCSGFTTSPRPAMPSWSRVLLSPRWTTSRAADTPSRRTRISIPSIPPCGSRSRGSPCTPIMERRRPSSRPASGSCSTSASRSRTATPLSPTASRTRSTTAPSARRSRLVATERSFRTLERLATAVADMLEERFRAANVIVRATKPEPPIPLPVEEVSVEVER